MCNAIKDVLAEAFNKILRKNLKKTIAKYQIVAKYQKYWHDWIHEALWA